MRVPNSFSAALVALLSASVNADNTGGVATTDERPPSLFKAGDEWLALPEVFSNLDFAADNTPASEDDIAAQLKLRNSRFWGRLYIDGWPQTIQFFRAHFGIEPPYGRKRIVFAEPRDACTDLDNADLLTSEHIVIANRGTCTFGSKAKIVAKTKASALIIVNNEPGLDHLPGPDAHDITFSVSSMGQQEGQNLETFYDEGPKEGGFGRELYGYMVPINCENSGARCVPATYEERRWVKNLATGGRLNLLPSNGKPLPESELPLEYLLAQFGTKAAHHNTELSIVVAKPPEACTPLENNVKGKLVLVRRGTCPFFKKVESVQAAGGAVMVLGGTSPYLLRMGVEPRWKGLNAVIPVAMVSKRAYNILVAESYAGAVATMVEDVNVNETVWETLEKYGNGEGWPRSEVYINKRFDELKEEHAVWPDRVAAITDAHAKHIKTVGGVGTKNEDASRKQNKNSEL